MPNRILKESICTSESLDALTWFEEVFFYRLLVSCDDFGRMDARPAVLKSKLFPLKDRLNLTDVKSALKKLADIGCIYLYDCDGKPYLCFPTWSLHQRLRNSKEKYPAPDMEQMETDCNNSRQVAASCGELRRVAARAGAESESESESESEVKRNIKEKPTQTYGEFGNVKLTDEEYAKLQELFPDYKQRIEKLSSYMASKGKQYKSHYATIRMWATGDKGDKPDKTSKPVGEDEFALRAFRKRAQ